MTHMNVGLREALAILKGTCASVREAIENGTSVPWFGSGISLSRVPGLPSLLSELLAKLYAGSDPSILNCPYQEAMKEVLALAGTKFLKLLGTDPTTWDCGERKELIGALTNKYSQVLQVAVRTSTKVLTVRWDILDLVQKYSAPEIEPDAEHFFIVLLMLDGAWRQSVSTNWDGLIEKADMMLSDGRRTSLFTIASPEDCGEQNGAAASLYKIHGCALKSHSDPAKYQGYLVATEHDIGNWAQGAHANAFKEALGTIIRSKRVIFVGLSGQDFNIKQQVISAHCPKSYDPHCPRIAFTTSSITPDHKTILIGAYSESVFNQHQPSILENATIPLYGKPFLGALWIDLLFRKARAIAEASDIAPQSLRFILDNVDFIQEQLCLLFDSRLAGSDLDSVWRSFALDIPSLLSNFVCLFREQRKYPTGTYRTLFTENLAELRASSNLPLLRMHWMLWALSLLAHGHKLGRWKVCLEFSPVAAESPVKLLLAGSIRSVILAGDSVRGLVKCIDNGFINDANADEIVLIYPADQKPIKSTRTPASTFRFRSSRSEPREVWLQDIYNESGTGDEALEALLMEVA